MRKVVVTKRLMFPWTLAKTYRVKQLSEQFCGTERAKDKILEADPNLEGDPNH